MNRRIISRYIIVLLFGVILFSVVGPASAAWYNGPIEYRQTMKAIILDTAVDGWKPAYDRHFREVVVNSEGTKLAFLVKLDIEADKHLYVMNTNGTGRKDLTANLPSGVTSTSDINSLQLNSSGSRLFFNAPWSDGSNIHGDFYYIDTATKACVTAASDVINFDNRKVFTLNTSGTRLFFLHWGGTTPEKKGLYYADVGGPFVKIMGADEPPGEGSCDGNINCLGYLGNQGNKALFSWNRGATPPCQGMWKTDGGAPVKVPNEEHNYVYAVSSLFNRLTGISAKKALYYTYEGSGPRRLYSVNLETGAKIFIAETYSGNGFGGPTISPSGNYARFSTANNKATRAHIASGDKRDTLSYWFDEFNRSSYHMISDLTADDRYYYVGSSSTDTEPSKIHKVDMAPTSFSPAPNIQSIKFSKPYLLFDDTTPITVRVTVSDAQGLGNIQWVRMQSLVDGLEAPEWLDYEPIDYDWALYDDGVHGGDVTAGDGIFTNNTLRVQDYSNFYEEYTLPRYVGIRIIARDKNYNYTIADTVISVTDIPLPVVTVEATDPNASEANTQKGTFRFQRTGDTSSPLTVKYKMWGTAENGVDYDELSGTRVIHAGSARRLLDLIPVNDSLKEGPETAKAVLVRSPTYTIGSPSSAVVTIADND